MGLQQPHSVSPAQFATPATVMIRPLLLKPQWMNGLSERLLVSHYENNYGGALRRLGYDARALNGGITAWHAIGGATVPLDTSTYEQLDARELQEARG